MNKSMLLGTWVAIFSVGCIAGGQDGSSGKLRFGQVYLFAEATDFSSAIAVGQKMPLGLQSTTKPALLNDYDYLDGTLDVLDASSAKLEVTKLLAGQFQAVFPKAGSYTLVGKNGLVEDRLTVTAADQAGLRMAKQWYLHGTGTDTKCKPAAPPEGKLPLLKSNQTLTLFVVPQSAAGVALIGLVDLKAEADGAVVSANAGISAGSFSISPVSGGAATHAVITFTDQKTRQSLKVELDLDPAHAEPCSG